MINDIQRPTEYRQEATGYKDRRGEPVTDQDELVYCLAEDVRQYAEDMEAELREAMELIERNRDTLAVGQYADTVTDTIDADDAFLAKHKAQTDTPWWEQLPPRTPVEARDLDDESWTLIRACDTHMLKQVRWPTPADNWDHARNCGFTHIAVQVSGTVILTSSTSGWPDEAVLVPIPRQEDSDDASK